MKQGAKAIVLCISLIVLFVAAILAYNYLPNRYNDVLTTTSNTSAAMQAEAKTDEHKAAADFTVTDSDGKSVNLSDFKGKPVVINFWATWCGPCQSELPAFDAAYKTYGDDVVFMMVDLVDGYRETVDDTKEFVSDGGYSFPVYFDTSAEAATAYSVYSIPMTVFVDSSGAVVQTHTGAMRDATLMGYIDSMLAGE